MAGAGAAAGALVVRKPMGQPGMCTLERDICVILRPCVEALVHFHVLGGNARRGIAEVLDGSV